MKPILACDYQADKAKFPYMALPKIDGVRALCIDGKLVGRSGKAFKNKLNTDFFSNEKFNGFDGEMVVDKITGFGICNETTSALSTIKGTVPTRWCLFDYILEGGTNHLPYIARYHLLVSKVLELYAKFPILLGRIWVIPYEDVLNQERLNEVELEYLNEQFEGVILRDPKGMYKHGRCTARESNYLRLKRFMEAEIEVTGVTEGKSNCNELKVNPHGYAERATIGDNMVPNGMIGTILGRVLKEEKLGDTVLLQEGQEVELSPGKMVHDERKHLFENQDKIIGRIAKFQFFPRGIKDKPRFPTFQGFRTPEDL